MAVSASRPTLLARLGASARRGLTGVLLAFSAALLYRPVLFLTAALGDGGSDLWAALAATAFHLAVLGLAISLFIRARRETS